MNDDDLKKDIEQALAVDPSPHFVARVRRHFANERRRPSRPLAWRVPVAALATAAVIAGIVALQPRQSTPARIVQTVNPAGRIEPPPMRVEVPQPVQAKPHKATAKPPQATELPEVLIDARETAAFRQFLKGLREQKIDPAMLNELAQAAERAGAATQNLPMPIAAIEPIAISPLTFPVVDKQEGGSL